jgi:hypothetical protein
MANDRFPRFPESKVAAGLTMLFLLTGCSSPKPAAVAASPTPPPAAVVVAAEHVDPSDTDKGDRYVAAVRESTMSGYPAKTIGNAFEAAFRDFKWESRTADGAHIVHFTGTLPDRVRQDCFTAKECAPDAKVTFQWTFTPDGRFFHLSYIDPEPWPEARRSTREMLLFIYG